ncbi:HEAT repeat-containing protein 3 [Megachile rotundata]|uniref:HEAT repeat-containing protein 3 n=1 Tax=Megachile rotundata TaxID=143995 RepID=UPI000258F3AC|nr:PREDICTED: HEAT repeat-containing protein 3 isoform X1 [Megachile rotundata]XP_012152558.1 PREDICTED: HEAT repeat-containing protein 3 isoform X1 [Megachile rotundata]
MGKERRQRRKPHKENPTGLPSVKDFEALEDDSKVNNVSEVALQTAYEEIQSANVGEKLSGLQTLESMSYDSTIAVQVATDGIAKMIGPLLIDPNATVRAYSASALRHIVDNGKTETHASLLKDDIMTPLCSLLKNYYAEWEPKSDQDKESNVKAEEDAFIQVVTLLWTLCEHNEDAVKIANEADIVSILKKFFDINTYNIEITTVTAQCLLSLSEDNPTAIKKLCSCENIISRLLNLETGNNDVADLIYLKTAISGLIINIVNLMDNDTTDIVQRVICVLSDTLSIDCKQLLSDLTSILPHKKNDYSDSAKKKVQTNRKILSAQQQALEILANLCVEDQENDDSNDSDINDIEFEIDGVNDVCMDDKLYNKTSSSLSPEIIEVFNSCNTLKKVWDKTVAVDKDTAEILEQNVEGEAVLKQMHILNCRAYLCLNNLISCLEMDTLGGIENIYRMWCNIGTVVFKDANPDDTELLESATAAMRAALEKLSEAEVNVFNQLTLNDIHPMLNGERQCKDPNIRVNLLRILGNLATVLTRNNVTESSELIKHISIFLLDTCLNESKVWVMAECMDAIMDIYAEDDSDKIASETKLIERLYGLVPLFKDKMRQQRKTLGDNIAVVSTVKNNIMRFIKYKEKRMRHV